MVVWYSGWWGRVRSCWSIRGSPRLGINLLVDWASFSPFPTWDCLSQISPITVSFDTRWAYYILFVLHNYCCLFWFPLLPVFLLRNYSCFVPVVVMLLIPNVVYYIGFLCFSSLSMSYMFSYPCLQIPLLGFTYVWFFIYTGYLVYLCLYIWWVSGFCCWQRVSYYCCSLISSHNIKFCSHLFNFVWQSIYVRIYSCFFISSSSCCVGVSLIVSYFFIILLIDFSVHPFRRSVVVWTSCLYSCSVLQCVFGRFKRMLAIVIFVASAWFEV